MLLLVVFILGYGVAAQALLYPVRPFYLYVFKDVFMLPYWQMYGELQLETTEGETCRRKRGGWVASELCARRQLGGGRGVVESLRLRC